MGCCTSSIQFNFQLRSSKSKCIRLRTDFLRGSNCEVAEKQKIVWAIRHVSYIFCGIYVSVSLHISEHFRRNDHFLSTSPTGMVPAGDGCIWKWSSPHPVTASIASRTITFVFLFVILFAHLDELSGLEQASWSQMIGNPQVKRRPTFFNRHG